MFAPKCRNKVNDLVSLSSTLNPTNFGNLNYKSGDSVLSD